MFKHNLKCAASRQSHRHQIRGIFLRKCQASGKSGKLWPSDDRQSYDCILNTSTEHTSYRKGKYKARKCQKQIGHTHQNSIQNSSAPATYNTNCGSDYSNDCYQKQCCINTRRASHQYSRKHIPSVTVSSQYMFCVGRFLRQQKILHIRIIRAEFPGKGCNYKQDQYQYCKQDQLFSHMVFLYFLPADSYRFFRFTHTLSPPSLTRGSR